MINCLLISFNKIKLKVINNGSVINSIIALIFSLFSKKMIV